MSVEPSIRIQRRAPPTQSHDLPENLHPVLQRVYLARALCRAEDLAQGLDALLAPDRLKGMPQAVGLLADAVQQQRRLLIVGDFDADGATSCAVGVRALNAMGVHDVHYLVPNRFEYGYGLTPEIVELAAQQGPDIIITVDNGISSVAGVAAAKQRGIGVIITDHHLPGATLPQADAMVNPNQPGDDFPSKNLAGVGVIFYVMLALRAELRRREWFDDQRPEPNLAQCLDLVALGTVADVVPLDHNNRILVAQGLARINRGQACPGIQALLAISGREPGQVTAADLGFALGPRLNAAGRLQDMSLGIACLLSQDNSSARGHAQHLDTLNRERRALQETMQAQAMELVQGLQWQDDALPLGLCLLDDDWHQGVVGLVASRVKERLHRPVIAFAPVAEDEIKGSARSVPGLHIRDALDAVAARHPELLQKFGGHAMAAGLSLRRQDYEAFAAAFDAEVGRHLSRDDCHGVQLSDGELSAQELDIELAELLRQAGPWGQQFPEPVFDGHFEVHSQRVVGQTHLKLVLRHAHNKDKLIDAIAFHQAPQGVVPDWTWVHAAYRVDINHYQGQRNLQLIIEHIQPSQGR